MTGRLEFMPSPLRPSSAALLHVHARWRFEHGELRFTDPRRFGGLKAFTNAESWQGAQQSLGPDALSVDGAQLFESVRHSRRAIKAALLDQSVLAGVGNIYADEALHIAGLRPSMSCTKLTPEDAARLSGCIVRVLNDSIRSGGSTRRDFVDAEGKKGSYQHNHAVYGRAGLACLRCTTTLKSATIAQRTTVWCPTCQPARTGRSRRICRSK